MLLRIKIAFKISFGLLDVIAAITQKTCHRNDYVRAF